MKLSSAINPSATTAPEPNPVVIVPVHKLSPTEDEEFSLRRCATVLSLHPIRIVHPQGLDLSAYRRLMPLAEPISVPDFWMSSVSAYNKMILNPDFFAIFDSYSHLLIHEPDAFVVSDRLLEWCQAGFDYIGAPWFPGYDNPLKDAPLLAVGNSGFSLFNIQTARRVLSSRYRWYPYKKAVEDIFFRLLRRPGPSGMIALRALGSAGQLRGAHKISTYNCDIFWSTFAARADPSFSIPEPEKAVFFSWETQPSTCHTICGGVFPFGIHAWAKYDRLFIEETIFRSLLR